MTFRIIETWPTRLFEPKGIPPRIQFSFPPEYSFPEYSPNPEYSFKSAETVRPSRLVIDFIFHIPRRRSTACLR